MAWPLLSTQVKGADKLSRGWERVLWTHSGPSCPRGRAWAPPRRAALAKRPFQPGSFRFLKQHDFMFLKTSWPARSAWAEPRPYLGGRTCTFGICPEAVSAGPRKLHLG